MINNESVRAEIATDSKNFNKLKYITSNFPISLINKVTGNICFWNNELNKWCISYYNVPELLLCDDFQYAMQKLVEPE